VRSFRSGSEVGSVINRRTELFFSFHRGQFLAESGLVFTLS
jgi:hypothetical protein